MKNYRWLATVVYRHDDEPELSYLEFNEFDEFDAFIEKGPHWGTIMSINIVYCGTEANLTVEQAEKQ